MPTAEQLRAHKFYHFTASRKGRKVPIIVWNGVKDYSWHPADELIDALPGGPQLLLQVSEESIQERIDAIWNLIDLHSCIIIWTKNSNVYRNACNILKASSSAAVKQAGHA